ncbi:hypothetical protein CVT24_011956 [Panaeolus cyanescens]|uniref:Uncharacterized protein n=1 Tax=Panaeolus cyanescens TaxID=181874 RepID=A0A409VIB4_9AGAR|nr:hypothetical protein CVT24_011956 [Panaeolus cyanescens]
MSTGDKPKPPPPRRLFSVDSVKSTHSRRSSADNVDVPKGPRLRQGSGLAELYKLAENQEKDAQLLEDVPLVTSPIEDSPPPSVSGRLEALRPPPLAAPKPYVPESKEETVTPSPTRMRWDSIRRHVLPPSGSSSRPSTPPVPPIPPSVHHFIQPQRSGSTQSSLTSIFPAPPSSHGHNQTGRSGTPKPSRLARLGFKQVVEHAREVIDDARRFGDEILRACAAARYNDSNGGAGGRSREGSAFGSSITLGAASNVIGKRQSLASLSALSNIGHGVGTSAGAGAAVNATPSSGPSLKLLSQILIYNSGMPANSTGEQQQQQAFYLPHESLILSTLLCPFLTPTKYPISRLEEEQRMAVEAFELVTKSWSAFDEAANVERCIWCTKAASSLAPSHLRTMILASLWRLLVPPPQNRILLSLHGFQSISSGLLLLLVSLYRSSTSPAPNPQSPSHYTTTAYTPTSFLQTSANFSNPPHPDIRLLQELITLVVDEGRFGELEDDRVEEEFGVEFEVGDRRADGEGGGMIRKLVFADAMLKCIENSAGTGEWLICWVIEKYWPTLSATHSLTTLQRLIRARIITTFCRLSMVLLEPYLVSLSSSNDGRTGGLHSQSSTIASTSSDGPTMPYRSTKIPNQIVSLLQKRVVGEVEELEEGWRKAGSARVSEEQGSANAKGRGRDNVVDIMREEMKMRLCKLLFRVICLDVEYDRQMSMPGPSARSGNLSASESDVFANPNSSMNTSVSMGGSVTSPTPRMNQNPATSMQFSVRWAIGALCGWWRGGRAEWREVVEGTLRSIISSDWTTSLPVFQSLLKNCPDEVRKPIFTILFPLINDHLLESPPPYPYTPLNTFLTTLSRTYPVIFFKPLFALAASNKEVVVVNHLCAVQAHAKYVSDYWWRDVEMLCMALLADGNAGPKPGNANGGGSGNMDGTFGNARLGQLVLLVEIVGAMQRVRHLKENADPKAAADGRFVEVVRFVNALETRLWLVIEAKERTMQLSPAQRMLFGMLFREFRLLSRSTKLAPWLSRMLTWFEVYCAEDHFGDLEKDVDTAVERVQGLYQAAQEGVQQAHKRHTSMLAAGLIKPPPSSVTESTSATTDSKGDVKYLDLAASFGESTKLLESLSKGYISKALKLFVTVSTLITQEHCLSLGPVLWQHCLFDNVDASTTASACFLLMQCAEKTPIDLLALIEVDLQTSDEQTRQEAVRKIAILTNWRFQIMSQNFLSDRNHRPFKLARPPLPFLATDMGSSLYVHMEEANEDTDKNDVPLELKKRLAELGWAEENAAEPDPREEWIKTPLSILPVNQADRLDVGTTDIFNTSPGGSGSNSPQASPVPSPRKPRAFRENLSPADEATANGGAVVRRNSSSGGPVNTAKRRAVFVPPLTQVFLRLISMVHDPNFVIASTARGTIIDLMRNDPALLTRPIFDLLSGEHKDTNFASTCFSSLLHIHRILPPPLTHNIFNNLAGFLKYSSRQLDVPDTLRDYALVVSVLDRLTIQVSGMTIREIRRSKLDHFLIPTGSLWFQSGAPKGPMFPRELGPNDDPFEPVPSSLVSITMIRVSQNLLFLSMIKRNYHDVQIIRKNMSRLVLPTLAQEMSDRELEMRDFMPRKSKTGVQRSLRNDTVEVLSLVLSRSYILLVAQIFRCMSRHSSDRQELAILIDGLNKTLVAHGDDINIVSQVLIAYMVATTRFRRMFTSGNGYNLFMPALMKVYTEKPNHPGIRAAIEYAVNRFYALHKEAFLFQSIDTIGQLAMLPELDGDWFAKGVYDLFLSLKKGPSSTIDVAGIHNANKAQERAALMIHTADEKPQTFLAAVRRVESQTGLQMSFQLPDEYESSKLGMDDFIRLFLTVIAHDVTISRAQHFFRLLRLLTPYLYNTSGPTKTVLSDGIQALGMILLKAFARAKGTDIASRIIHRDEGTPFVPPKPEDAPLDSSRGPCDSRAMRMDYLQMTYSFGRAGGQLSLATTRQVLEVLKSLLKDSSENSYPPLAVFLSDFVRMLLIRPDIQTKAVIAFLRDVSPILHSYMVVVDFTGVFETVLKLTQVPNYANDSHFAEVVVNEICTAGLAACDLAASEGRLMTLPCRPVLIQLLAESVFFKSVDVFAEIERRPPTYTFLAGVVFPFSLALKTQSVIIADGMRPEEHRKALIHTWIRILSYVMTACQQSRKEDETMRRGLRGLGGSFKSKNSDKDRGEGSFWRSHLPTFMIALQILKVIIIRAAVDIDSIPGLGIWERITLFLRTMLVEGNAAFAFKKELGSAANTPTGSPRTPTFDLPQSGSHLSIAGSIARPGSPFSQRSFTRISRPRLIDYTLWSMLEFVCAYRSPLRTSLKLLVIEKVVNLNQELRMQQMKGTLTPVPKTAGSRRVSTVFAKNRVRSSGIGSPLSHSPESSPLLKPSTSSNLLPVPTLEIPTTNVRRAGYQISPITPVDRAEGIPKIVHLGPASPSAFAPISSPIIGVGLAGGLKALNSKDGEKSPTPTTNIKSITLVQATYHRIRGVQAYLGYDVLLPMPGSSSSSDDIAAPQTWSPHQALQSVVKETKELLEEFDQQFEGEDDVAFDVVNDDFVLSPVILEPPSSA